MGCQLKRVPADLDEPGPAQTGFVGRTAPLPDSEPLCADDQLAVRAADVGVVEATAFGKSRLALARIIVGPQPVGHEAAAGFETARNKIRHPLQPSSHWNSAPMTNFWLAVVLMAHCSFGICRMANA